MIEFVIAFLLLGLGPIGLLMILFLWLIYAAAAYGIVERTYLRKGWMQVG